MLKFPLEDRDRYQGRILFQKHAATPLDLTKTEGVIRTLGGATVDTLQFGARAVLGALLPNVPERYKNPIKELDTSAQLGPSQEPQSKRVDQEAGLSGTCMMYLPQAITLADGVNNNTVSLGIFGGLIERQLQGGDGIAASLAAALGEAGSSIADVVSGGVSPEIFAIAAGRLTQVQPTTNAAIRSATAITPNPNMRVIFEGVKLREFSLAFEMMPKTPQETTEIKNIIKYFRSGMIPESIRAGGISAGYRTPSKFSVSIQHDKNVRDDLAVKFQKCFLNNVQTSYNGQNMAFTPDGNFQRYEITLNFVEEQTIDRQDVEAGF